MIKIQNCCGKNMKVNDFGRFVEFECEKCGHLVYLKKYSDSQKPVLPDD